MDTFKDKQSLEDLNAQPSTPWKVWRNGSARGRLEAPVAITAGA
jgi:hypothetical protein